VARPLLGAGRYCLQYKRPLNTMMMHPSHAAFFRFSFGVKPFKSRAISAKVRAVEISADQCDLSNCHSADGHKKLKEHDIEQDTKHVHIHCDDVSFYEGFSSCWKAKIITIEPIVFLYVLERFILVLFSGLYYYQRFARDSLRTSNHSMTSEHFCINSSYLDNVLGKGASDSVENNATQMTFFVVLSGTLVSITSTVILGPLTDTYGRKFALISVYIGRMIGELMVLIIVYYSLDLDWYIIATVISSVFGDYGVFVMAITAYVADISSFKMRLLRIGVLGLVTYISTGVGTIISGTWINEVDCDFKSVAWAPFICCVIGVLASMFAIPESLSEDKRDLNRSSTKSCNRLKIIWSGLLLYFRYKLVTIKLWISLFVLLILLTIAQGSLLIETFFFIRQPLEWTPEQIGLYGGYNSLTHGLALLLLMPVTLAIGIPDVVLAIIGALSSCLGYLFTAGVRKTWQMFASRCNLIMLLV